MDRIIQCYRHIPKEKLRQCVDDLNSSLGLSKEEIERYILEHSVDNLRLDGAARICKLESKKYKKTIYLIGEYHTDNFTCKRDVPQIHIADLLVAYIHQTSDPIDVFIEAPYITLDEEVSYGASSYRWEQIYEKFGECLKRVKKECPYRKNVRFQYTDFRYNLEDPILFYDSAHKKFNREWSEARGRDLEKVASNFLKFVEGKSFVGIKEKILNVPRLKKQLDAIGNKRLRKKIVEFFDLQRLEDAWVRMIVMLKDFVKGREKPINIFEQYEKIANANTYIMDLYLMARIFRSFRKVPGVHSEDPTNIFIYAGDFHSINYGEFLMGNLGFKITANSEMTQRAVVEENDTCVPLLKELKEIVRKDWLG